jgi:hypothetical protein
MWVFKKDGKSWTCPDSSLIQIARIQASDRNDEMKEKIFNGDIAKKYLESLGFEVTYIQEEPLKIVPEYYEARWYDPQHRALYDEISRKSFNGVPLTEKERAFDIAMYHLEEGYAGLL